MKKILLSFFAVSALSPSIFASDLQCDVKLVAASGTIDQAPVILSLKPVDDLHDQKECQLDAKNKITVGAIKKISLNVLR